MLEKDIENKMTTSASKSTAAVISTALKR